MNLSDSQRAEVAKWIEGGAKLSEVQNRLAEEMGIKLTYMEVRFLVDDLKLVPKDPEPSSVPEPTPAKPAPGAGVEPPTARAAADSKLGSAGSVSVSVDHIARPGALVSGKVKFSDGQAAEWSLDQMGRLGLVPSQKGYRPSPGDVEQFQIALQNEMAKLGY